MLADGSGRRGPNQSTHEQHGPRIAVNSEHHQSGQGEGNHDQPRDGGYEGAGQNRTIDGRLKEFVSHCPSPSRC